MLVAEGDRVPADAVLLSCDNLQADESLLTGESVPVRKLAAADTPREAAAAARPGGDDLPTIYAGTLVVQGQGIAEVIATGPRTEMGRIGQALESTDREPTDLQRQSGRLVRNMALRGALRLRPGGAHLRSDPRPLDRRASGRRDPGHGHAARGDPGGAHGLPGPGRVADQPEERPHPQDPGRGVARLGHRPVRGQDRHPDAEPDDHRPALRRWPVLRGPESGAEPAGGDSDRRLLDAPALEPFHELVEYGILASELDPFDPMEKAFKDLGTTYFAGSEHLHDDWQIVHEYPLSRELLAMSHVWRSPDGDAHVIAAKGAPEAIADLCHLDASQHRGTRPGPSRPWPTTA